MILEPNYIDSLFPASFFQVGNSLIGFSSNSLVFCERKLLFCQERPERIAHGLSFVKSDESESLKLLKLLFKKELMSEELMSEGSDLLFGIRKIRIF